VDIPKVLGSPLGQPFAAYLVQCLSHNATLAILSLTIIAGFAMGQGCMIAASRVTFAYARDDCFPLSRLWKHVNVYTRTPVNAVWFNTAVGCACLLLIFAGEIAIGAIFSIGACAAFVAFTTPICIRVFFVGNRFRAGPWNLGRFSIPIGCIATAFVALMVPILCLPSVTGKDLDSTTMNWTSVVYGGPMVSSPFPDPSLEVPLLTIHSQLLVLIWWFVDAHKWFKGPKVNLEHLMHGRDNQAAEIAKEDGIVLDGQEDDSSSGSDRNVPGAQPEGVNVGDLKSQGL
jgi:amino acid transporter